MIPGMSSKHVPGMSAYPKREIVWRDTGETLPAARLDVSPWIKDEGVAVELRVEMGRCRGGGEEHACGDGHTTGESDRFHGFTPDRGWYRT